MGHLLATEGESKLKLWIKDLTLLGCGGGGGRGGRGGGGGGGGGSHWYWIGSRSHSVLLSTSSPVTVIEDRSM